MDRSQPHGGGAQLRHKVREAVCGGGACVAPAARSSRFSVEVSGKKEDRGCYLDLLGDIMIDVDFSTGDF